MGTAKLERHCVFFFSPRGYEVGHLGGGGEGAGGHDDCLCVRYLLLTLFFVFFSCFSSFCLLLGVGQGQISLLVLISPCGSHCEMTRCCDGKKIPGNVSLMVRFGFFSFFLFSIFMFFCFITFFYFLRQFRFGRGAARRAYSSGGGSARPASRNVCAIACACSCSCAYFWSGFSMRPVCTSRNIGTVAAGNIGTIAAGNIDTMAETGDIGT